MKYLPLLLLLSSCSLIKINESPKVPRVRPEYIGVTAIIDATEYETRVRVSEIVTYTKSENDMCTLVLRGYEPIRTTSTCNDIDGELRK